MSVIYATSNKWQEAIASEFCEQNDVDLYIDRIERSTRFIMRRRSTGTYSVRLVDTRFLTSVMPLILFNTMLNEIIESEKLV
jgi:hypothetical protein